MNKSEESLNNLYVNISLIDNETIRDKSFEDLETIRKEFKAFEIIKKKNVDIWNIKATFTVEQYNRTITKYDGWEVFNLTKEEYNLLKEELENEIH